MKDRPDHHRLMDGRLHVYKRGGRHWQCSTVVKGRNWRVSTKCETYPEAKQFAEDWFHTLRSKDRAGVLKHGHRFRQAADKFIAEYEALTQGRRHPVYVLGHRRRLNNHLIPFFGERVLSEITPGMAQEYRVHRLATSNEQRGKPPARNTIHQEIVVLRQVLKWAIRQGWLQYLPDLSEPYRGNGKITHRAWFSPEEYKQLYEATRRRVKTPKSRRYEWECGQLHDMVLFMANTGLRPDEVLRLEHRDVSIVRDDATDETILEIEVRGKRGVGYCKSTTGAVTPYRRIVRRNKPQPTDRVFPKPHHQLFNIILEEEGLKVDREGQRRTLYSLRHTYICLRLMEGADIYQIAKNCRTSVEMIEKYYASHIKNRLDAAAINVRRAKPKARVEEARRGEDQM